MIIYVNSPRASSCNPFADAFGGQASDGMTLTTPPAVAHWPGARYYPGSERWSAAQWAAHLDDPAWAYPSPGPDSPPPIWHAHARLHPADRDLSDRDWSEIAHRLAGAANLEESDEGHACRWVAVRVRPGRLDLVANLVRGDGTWADPHRALPRLTAECRRIEADLGLITPPPGQVHGQVTESSAMLRQQEQLTPESADATAVLAPMLRQLADEPHGPLAAVRGLIEKAAFRLDQLPQGHGPATGQQLQLIARRLHGLQRDINSTAASLPPAKQTTTCSPVASPPTSSQTRVTR
ncbi:hypothetical protein [Streptomyces lasiicapitis]|uniref:hypothetical protein n=1 Tax=Streptomyces lasiicapitis TaxID=1923961 RepID=UPI0036CAAA84